MLEIRLSRIGKKKQPSYRIILQEHTASPKGEFQEILGHYRPYENPKAFDFKKERIAHLISEGANVSDTVAVLLKGVGIPGMEKFIELRNKKRKKKGEEAPAAPEKTAPAEKAEKLATESKESK